MDDFGLQPPPPPAPPIPPQPLASIPQVPKEEPEIVKPSNQMGKAIKKNGIKLVGGVLMAVLIIGGAVLGSSLLKEKQRPVEKQAADLCGTVDGCPGCDEECYGKNKGDICRGTDTCQQNDKLYSSCSCGPKPSDPPTGACTGAPNPDGCFIKGGTGVCNQYGCTVPSGGYVTKYTCDDPNCDPTDDPSDEDHCGCSQNPVTYRTYNECVQLTNDCGIQQIDVGNSAKDYVSRICIKGCSSPSPEPSPSPSPSPTPGTSMSCVDLASDISINEIAYGDEVLFSCEASFSGVSPRAFFRTSFDGGTTYSSNIPAVGVPVNLTTNIASQSIAIDQYGDWIVQCRICDNTATTCTAWGLAN